MDRAKILVVEDNPQDREFLIQTLAYDRYQIVTAPNGAIALSLFEKEKPDAVILDVVLPDIDGSEVYRRLRKNKTSPAVPILFYTVPVAFDEEFLCRDAGAVDFLAKGNGPRELLVRMRNLLHAKKMSKDCVNVSFFDRLTAVYNRRYFQQRLRDEFDRGCRYRSAFSCLIVNIDNFKAVNAGYGRLMGDRVLVRVADLLRRSVRLADVVCRCGADEFGCLFPETDLQGAYLAAERVRHIVKATEIRCNETMLRLTVSCGVSAFTAALSGSEEIVARADSALFQAKQRGCNRTNVFLGRALAAAAPVATETVHAPEGLV